VKALHLHGWNVTPKQAVKIQLRLRERLERKDRLRALRRVAGADVALDLPNGRAIAGVIVYTFPEMIEIERAWAARPLRFPYVPGLLSFREIPALLAAFAKLRNEPDLVFCDGQGYAHPRRFGIASHLGVLLDCPSVGCAKSILVGKAKEPGRRAGSQAALTDKDEVVGVAVRTKSGAKPIYVSPGHRVSLSAAVRLTLAVVDGYRIPRTTREADRYVAAVKLGSEANGVRNKNGRRKP
jgi:deoxyribonuclease V